MAILKYKNETTRDAQTISSLMTGFGLGYEQWPVLEGVNELNDDRVLESYKNEITKLSTQRGYASADLVALTPATPNLDVICAKFDKEHHHTDDEVRYVVAGEGVFSIATGVGDEFVDITCEPGDLILVPAMRRHSFFLTDKKNIRCIRLFKDKSGWEAIYHT